MHSCLLAAAHESYGIRNQHPLGHEAGKCAPCFALARTCAGRKDLKFLVVLNMIIATVPLALGPDSRARLAGLSRGLQTWKSSRRLWMEARDPADKRDATASA